MVHSDHRAEENPKPKPKYHPPQNNPPQIETFFVMLSHCPSLFHPHVHHLLSGSCVALCCVAYRWVGLREPSLTLALHAAVAIIHPIWMQAFVSRDKAHPIQDGVHVLGLSGRQRQLELLWRGGGWFAHLSDGRAIGCVGLAQNTRPAPAHHLHAVGGRLVVQHVDEELAHAAERGGGLLRGDVRLQGRGQVGEDVVQHLWARGGRGRWKPEILRPPGPGVVGQPTHAHTHGVVGFWLLLKDPRGEGECDKFPTQMGTKKWAA